MEGLPGKVIFHGVGESIKSGEDQEAEYSRQTESKFKGPEAGMWWLVWLEQRLLLTLIKSCSWHSALLLPQARNRSQL